MPKTMQDVAEIMRDIDFTMLSTKTADGGIAARPMSNNRDVDYDGDSWFFALDTTDTAREIAADPNVGLTLHGNKGLLGKPPVFVAAEGKAELIRDRAAFEAHWVKDLDRWFEQGVDTPGLVLIKVHADRVHYWDGEDQGEIRP
ncbi:pyridoxamine 5'-phosphate oxidase family protein [Sphingomonas sp.]|uniref:pyridoxamine 5'-phosphate oxidase family protein n=1 Tax=Sphingomonas sp. TaxID=28214 RepID=UPI002DD65B32|nr:pyridoxamine 5'-phosphate oxidase family protein [Sphingomonas sp.]